MSNSIVHQVAELIAQGYEVDRLPEVNHHDLRAATLLVESPLMLKLLREAYKAGHDSYPINSGAKIDDQGRKVRAENLYGSPKWHEA